MRFVFNVAAFIVVGVVMFLLVRTSTDSDMSPEEEAAYRDWAVSVAHNQVSGLDRSYGVSMTDGAADPSLAFYEDPGLYGDDRLVLTTGQTREGQVEIALPPDTPVDQAPQFTVVRNELQTYGVDVQIVDVRLVRNGYFVWEAQGRHGPLVLTTLNPRRDARQTGALTQRELASALDSGVLFNAPVKDAFDLQRGTAYDTVARVRYRVAVPAGAPVRVDDPSLWGEVVIAAGRGGREPAFRAHLVHLESFEGVALRVDE
jgi:hypothetical protein